MLLFVRPTMSWKYQVGQLLNRWLLQLANLRLVSLTAGRLEHRRLLGLAESGQFSEQIFPLPESMGQADPSPF